MALQHYPRIMNPPAPAPPIVILDTNVVLDWLVFHNPECATVQTSVAAGHVHWVATTAMRDELTQVLARGDLDAWNPDLPALWAHWERHCIEVPAPAPCRPTSRCGEDWPPCGIRRSVRRAACNPGAGCRHFDADLVQAAGELQHCTVAAEERAPAPTSLTAARRTGGGSRQKTDSDSKIPGTRLVPQQALPSM